MKSCFSDVDAPYFIDVSMKYVLFLCNSDEYTHTELWRITAELWEIPVVSPAVGAIILHMIRYNYFFGVTVFPVFAQEPYVEGL